MAEIQSATCDLYFPRGEVAQKRKDGKLISHKLESFRLCRRVIAANIQFLVFSHCCQSSAEKRCTTPSVRQGDSNYLHLQPHSTVLLQANDFAAQMSKRSARQTNCCHWAAVPEKFGECIIGPRKLNAVNE